MIGGLMFAVFLVLVSFGWAELLDRDARRRNSLRTIGRDINVPKSGDRS